MEALTAVGSAVRVWCHRDYTPRNLIVGASGLYVVDFEWSRPDAVGISDLARLHLGIWENRPDLSHAFMRGYGRELKPQSPRHSPGLRSAHRLVVPDQGTGRPASGRSEEGSRAALQRILAA